MWQTFEKTLEEGIVRLRSGQVRSLALGLIVLPIATFVLGVVVGRGMAPEKEPPQLEPRAAARVAEAVDSQRAAVAGSAAPAEVARPAAPVEPAVVIAAIPEPLDEAEAEPPSAAEEPVAAQVDEPSEPDAPDEVTQEPAEEREPEPEVDEPQILTQPEDLIEFPPPVADELAPEVVEAPRMAIETSSLPQPGQEGGFLIQMAAYADRAQAEALLADLRAAGVAGQLQEADVRGETWYRVRVGRFATRADTQAWINALTPVSPFPPMVVQE